LEYDRKSTSPASTSSSPLNQKPAVALLILPVTSDSPLRSCGQSGIADHA
jgi:hypothetical protein